MNREQGTSLWLRRFRGVRPPAVSTFSALSTDTIRFRVTGARFHADICTGDKGLRA